MMPTARFFRLILPAILIAILTVPMGCDTLDTGGEALITERDFDFVFRTSGDQLAGGATISSESKLDVGAALAEIGFAKGDIVSAEVVGAQLRLVQPLTSSLSDIVSSASIRLSSGGNQTTVAQVSNIGSGASANMDTAGGDIGAITRASSAGVTLVVVPVSGDLPAGNYVFRARLSIRMTLEGV